MGDQTLHLHFSAAKLRIAILCFSLFSLYLFILQYLAVLFIGVLWCKLFYLTSQAHGPFYPVLTGRRDNIYSYFNKALAEFPWLDNNIIKTLPLFDLKRFWWKGNSLSFRYLLVLCLFSFYALVLWNWKRFKMLLWFASVSWSSEVALKIGKIGWVHTETPLWLQEDRTAWPNQSFWFPHWHENEVPRQ